MTQDLQALRKRFDPLFPAVIDVKEGWHPLLLSLDIQLSKLDPAYTIEQIKEKFGTLCFYCKIKTSVEAEARALINAAEDASSVTCEDCGKLASLRQDGWMRTLCDACCRVFGTTHV